MFVDDQEHFLNAIELAIPGDQPSSFWMNPNRCLVYLVDRGDNQALSLDMESISLSDEDVLVRFELDQLLGLPTNVNRFSTVGVVVVDYAMPGITGLEFLSNLGDRGFKKILLTGVADEKVAVEAFNEGLIDRFVLKSDQQAMEKVVQYCDELARERLDENQRQIVNILPRELRSLLQSENIVEVFSEVIVSYKVCEYYFSSKPLGYLCLDAKGSAFFLAFVTKNDLEKSAASLVACDAPEYLQQGVFSNRTYTGLFEDPNMMNAGDYDWDYNSIELKSIGDDDQLFWGVHQNPPIEVDYDSSSCSLDAYLSETLRSLW